MTNEELYEFYQRANDLNSWSLAKSEEALARSVASSLRAQMRMVESGKLSLEFSVMMLLALACVFSFLLGRAL